MRRKKVLSVFLAVLCFVFACCPFLAYGATDFSFTLIQIISTDSSGTSEQGAGNLPYKFIAEDIMQDDCRTINAFFSEDTFNVQKDDTVELHVEIATDDWGTVRYTGMTVYAYLYCPSSATASSAGMVERVTGSFDSSSQEITAEIPCSRDYTDAYIVLSLSNFKLETSSGTDYSKYGAIMTISSGYAQIIDPEKGFWSSVVDWFQQIFDSITEGFDNIGTWFTNLGNKISTGFTNMINNISSFFTELGNNLKGWFEDVGDWFSNLGSTISGWFTDLFDWFDEQLQAIQDWWESVKQWFHDLFVPEDGYFETWKQQWQDWFKEHFGAVYQSFEIISTLISAIFAVPTSSINYIEYPSLTVPVVDITILEGGKFYWDDILTNQFFETVFTMFRGVCTVLAIWSVIMFAKKTLDDVLGARDV